MPLVRIELAAGKPVEYRRAIWRVVYDALLTINVPKDDRFQIITENAPADLIIDPTYLGIARSAECVIIQITLNEGRTLAQKRALHTGIADGLHHLLGMRCEDVHQPSGSLQRQLVVRKRRGTVRAARIPSRDDLMICAVAAITGKVGSRRP